MTTPPTDADVDPASTSAHISVPNAPKLAPAMLKPWRRAFIGYAVTLFIATHWPALTLGHEAPVSDKTIHFAAFGIGTWLLSMTRWFHSVAVLAGVAFAWSVFDELTQGLPGIRRHVGWRDIAANGAGVLVVASYVWAWRPRGGPGARWRDAFMAAAFYRVFMRRSPWILMIALALVSGLTWFVLRTTSIHEIPIARSFLHNDELEPVIVAAVMIIAVHIAAGALFVWWNRALDDAEAHRWCLSCAEPRSSMAPVDATGCVRCNACATELWDGGYVQRSRPRAGVVWREAIPGIVFVLLGFAVMFSVVRIFPAHELSLHSPALDRTIDLTVLLLLIAIGVFRLKKGLAACYDRPGTCRRCGHDLRAVQVDERGIGRCSECGTSLVSVSSAAN